MITSALLWRKQPTGKHPLFLMPRVFFFEGGGGVSRKPRKTTIGERGVKNGQKRPRGLCIVPCMNSSYGRINKFLLGISLKATVTVLLIHKPLYETKGMLWFFYQFFYAFANILILTSVSLSFSFQKNCFTLYFKRKYEKEYKNNQILKKTLPKVAFLCLIINTDCLSMFYVFSSWTLALDLYFPLIPC